MSHIRRVPVLPWAWALLCSTTGEGGAQGTTGCWERTPAPGGGGARPKNHLAKPPIRVLQSTAGSTETQSRQGVGVGGGRDGERAVAAACQLGKVTTSCRERKNKLLNVATDSKVKVLWSQNYEQGSFLSPYTTNTHKHTHRHTHTWNYLNSLFLLGPSTSCWWC